VACVREDTELAHPRTAPAGVTTENPLQVALGEFALEALISEIRRYLAVVEAFRGEGCEPCWS
jgi:hypothetical protein